MKSSFPVVRLVLCVALALPFLSTDRIHAAIFSYDFEGVATGGLEGQDGWSKLQSHWDDATVVDGTDTNLSRFATATVLSGNPTGLHRSIAPLTFDAADTAIEQHVWVNAQLGATGGLEWSGVSPWYMLFGLSGDQGKCTSYLRDATGLEHYGEDRVWGHWYDMKLAMDFSTTGGLATLYYRNVTTNETAYTRDTLLTNVNMGLTPTAGQYMANGISFRLDGGAGSIDNFSVVPEPSSMALVLAGLAGLVAYAWKKRS
jgi:hypothetical protein